MTLHQTDQMHRFVLENCNIRGELIILDKSYIQATEHQQLALEHKTLLGQFLVAASLLAETLKFDGVLTVQARGDGPVPLIMSEATSARTLRGIAKPKSERTELPSTLAEAVGSGVLTLTIDPKQGQRYQGIVPLEKHSLAECLTDYFVQSEQLPTRLWLFADERRAAGLLLQALPNTGGTADQSRVQVDAWETAEALAQTVTADELLNLEPGETLTRLFNEFDVRLFAPHPVAFACSCSAERSLIALSALGREDAHALLAERDIIDVDCEFCGAKYQFGQADLDALFGAAGPLH